MNRWCTLYATGTVFFSHVSLGVLFSSFVLGGVLCVCVEGRSLLLLLVLLNYEYSVKS